MMDISLAADPSECGRDEIIRLKTASLFSFASESGATLGGGSQKEIECMKKYGLQVGMAFQIKDDILDIVGNAKTIGKPNGNDLKNGKSTLPVLHAIKNGGIKKGEGALGSRDNPTRLSELLKQRGSIDYAERIARKIINDAKDNLQMVRDWSVRRFLVTLADYAIGWG
jgi:geranylgeranyl pyrophosphate synthase